MKKQTLLLVSLDKDIITLINQIDSYHLLGFLDKLGTAYDGQYPNLGDDIAWISIKQQYESLSAVLALDPPILRKKLTKWYGLENLATLIGKNSCVDASAQIGQGSIIQDKVYISRDVIVGSACKINVNASIHHDVRLGDYSTIAPGAQLLGKVTIGTCCYIGAGSIILPNITIGDRVVVGAGAVVTKNIEVGTTVVGVPAKKAIKI
jgi:sugar O-acyltransferase (sialic acid O-acetyltransferase NeuD family)